MFRFSIQPPLRENVRRYKRSLWFRPIARRFPLYTLQCRFSFPLSLFESPAALRLSRVEAHPAPPIFSVSEIPRLVHSGFRVVLVVKVCLCLEFWSFFRGIIEFFPALLGKARGLFDFFPRATGQRDPVLFWRASSRESVPLLPREVFGCRVSLPLRSYPYPRPARAACGAARIMCLFRFIRAT